MSLLLCLWAVFSYQQERGSGVIQPSREGLAPLTLPDTSKLEAVVDGQIRQFQDLLAARVEENDPELLARSYLQLGELYHAYAYLEEAAICYGNVVVLDPDEVVAVYHMARIYHAQGKADLAEGAYVKAGRLRKDYLPIWYHLGNLYKEGHDLKSARAHFETAARLAPNSAAVFYGLGQVALAEGDLEAAVGFLTKTLTLMPQANRVHYVLGTAYRRMGKLEKAREHLAKAGKIGPTVADAISDRLKNLIGSARIHIMRGKTAYAAGDYESALREFQAANEADPGNVTAKIDLATTLVSKGDTSRAIALFKEALALDGSRTTAHYNLGYIYRRLNKVAEADHHLRETLKQNPNDVYALVELAQLRTSSKLFQEALDLYARAIKLAPNFEAALLGRANILIMTGNYAPAAKILLQDCNNNPSSGRLLHLYARLLAVCPDKSIRNAQLAVELATKVAEAIPEIEHMETLALALAEVGRCDEAAQLQLKIIEAAQDQSEAYKAQLKNDLQRYQGGSPCGI